MFLPLMTAAAADVSGTWKLEGEVAGVQISRMCALKQAEKKITGTCKGAMGEVTLAGEVDGKKVSFSYQADYQGQKLTVAYKGTLESDTLMKGDISADVATGSFKAEKQ